MMTNAAREEKCSQLVMIAWALWCNRNEIYHGGEGKTGLAVALWAASYLQEYWSAVETHDAAVSNVALHLAENQKGLCIQLGFLLHRVLVKLMWMVLSFPLRSWPVLV